MSNYIMTCFQSQQGLLWVEGGKAEEKHKTQPQSYVVCSHSLQCTYVQDRLQADVCTPFAFKPTWIRLSPSSQREFVLHLQVQEHYTPHPHLCPNVILRHRFNIDRAIRWSVPLPRPAKPIGKMSELENTQASTAPSNRAISALNKNKNPCQECRKVRKKVSSHLCPFQILCLVISLG